MTFNAIAPSSLSEQQTQNLAQRELTRKSDQTRRRHWTLIPKIRASIQPNLNQVRHA